MPGEEKLQSFLRKHPHAHLEFTRPHWNRREFFRIAGSGVTGAFFARQAKADETVLQVTPQNKAKSVIFILLAGAPSHTDTFDFKMVDGVTPTDFAPEKINGIDWPVGLLPKTAAQLPHIAIVRSVRAWALVHSLAQVWAQIGRSPVAALGDVSPNIGSVVALEKEPERQPSQILPCFLALNAAGAPGSGYLPSAYAPFKLNPAATGIPNTSNADGEARLDNRLSFLHKIDDPLRVNSPLGRAPEDYNIFYQAARNMMYNPAVDQAFRFTAADSQRYGGTAFGNACLVSKQVLAANQGTRYIEIQLGGWDHHTDIYGAQNPNGNNIRALGRQLDQGYSALLGDLDSSGLLRETLVVLCGEFGRTVGQLSGAGGRDHYLQQFVAFAGAGVRGGRAIGATNAFGSAVSDYGWKYDRHVRTEDVEATVHSALGIDWTKQIETPFGRTFEYVPYAAEGIYAPIDELWA